MPALSNRKVSCDNKKDKAPHHNNEQNSELLDAF